MRYIINLFIAALFATIAASFMAYGTEIEQPQKDFIKWVDFNAGWQIIDAAYKYDLQTYDTDGHITMQQSLAYLACKNGNKFSYKTDINNFTKLKELLKTKSLHDIIGSNKYYNYYYNAYNAIFDGFLDVNEDYSYGLKCYFPLAAGYWYKEGDDFGNARAYGFKRRHLGHDMFAGLGTPIIAVEGGIVTELGWNRYGGWRIGISSHDNMRYYYYAHLRKGKPFHADIEKGKPVVAGQVIGYVGATGYSNKPDSNMSAKPHLHFGMQLIFDESQRDGNGEIWIDVYQIGKFLAKNNKIKVVKNANNTDYNTVYNKPA